MTREQQAATNRQRFTAAAELADMMRAAGLDGRITYAENDKGERIGQTFEERFPREDSAA